MWASAILVRQSGRPFARATPVSLTSTLGTIDVRSFSSNDDDSNDRNRGNRPPPFDRRGGRGGGGGHGFRGGGRGGGRGSPFHRNNDYNQQEQQEWSHGRRPHKPNFAQKVLQPAAEGQLKNHQSLVPRTIGKKGKGHSVRGADVLPPKDEEAFDDLMEGEDIADYTMEPSKSSTPSRRGTMVNNSPVEELSPEEREKLDDFLHDYNILINTEEEEKYYWAESEYDASGEAKRAEVFERLYAEATRDVEGNLVVEVDDETYAMFDGVSPEEAAKDNTKPSERRPQGMSPADDPVFQFVVEAMGIEGLDKPPPPDYDRVLPLQLSGPSMYDFVESMMNHPSKFGEIRWEAPNEERDREPLAEFPPNRRNPPPEFAEANKRFIYVWGLPPLMIEGQTVDLENPLHSIEIQKMVGNSFDVPIEQVSVASPSSAFVGFPDVNDHKFALAVGPMFKTIESPVTISKFHSSGDFALAKDHPDALVLLENLPLGWTPTLMASSLFPPGTEVGEVYGTLSADRIVMLSPNSAVIAMESAEAADNAITSGMVQERMLEIGQHRIRYAKARRELVYSGTHGGPDGTEPQRKLGDKLVVDGDMPTKALFTAHASTLYLRNLDPTVTKRDIADYFQPFCSVARDVELSTELVTCRDGLPTGRAFVGFDELGEAELALEALSKGGGRLTGLGPTSVIAKLVKERKPKKAHEKRPTRFDDELLDSLNNWQQYVEPEDLQELLDHCISLESLDEAFRNIRYHNPTFASMDQARRNETINPEKDAGGMYKELVMTYVATLKECLSTPENPGPIYESIHFPDEPLDTEIFEMEPQRQEELRKRRGAP